jgi:hypothetical protein
MMKMRWYLGFKSRHSPQELVKQISEKILESNLSKYIPMIRLEKRTKSRGEFYFFIAIESLDKGTVPEEVSRSCLLKLKFFTIPAVYAGASFSYEQIKPMVGAAHDVHDYTNPIPYKLLPLAINEHPFSFVLAQETNYSSQTIQTIDASSKHKQLLYWLSALGCGTWESFKKTCDRLDIEEPKRVLRRLKLLGHVESSPDGKRWSIAPTALVQIPSTSNLQEYILCGQQNIQLLDELQKYTKLTLIDQLRGDAPPCIRIQLDSLNNIFTLSENISPNFSITDAGYVSKQLASLLPDIHTWKNSLAKLPSIVSSCYRWQKFDGNDFADCGLPSESGMYQMYNQEANDSSPLRTLFYDKQSDRWLQGDWYGLRFLALQQANHQCNFYYNFGTRCLVIPASQRFPEIYERALVLASGILPTYKDSYLFYANIEPDVVNLLSAKLNLICGGESTYA